MQTKDLKLQELAHEICEEVKAAKEGGVLAVSYLDKRLAVSMGGDAGEMVLMLARAINNAPELADVLIGALKAAPLLDILEQNGRSSATCDCPRCTAERAAKKSNPNVN